MYKESQIVHIRLTLSPETVTNCTCQVYTLTRKSQIVHVSLTLMLEIVTNCPCQYLLSLEIVTETGHDSKFHYEYTMVAECISSTLFSGRHDYKIIDDILVGS